MATPAFRAAGTTAFSVNNVVNPTTLAPGAPTGKAVGDLLVLVCACISRTATVATPAGWTVHPSFPQRSGTASGGTFYVFLRKADGSGTDTPSPVWSGLTTGTSGDSCSAVILSFTGASPIADGVSTLTDDGADTTTTTIPATTTTQSGDLVVGMALKVGDLSSTSTVATFTEAVDATTTSGTGHTLEVSYLTPLTPAGSSGTAAITWSVTTSARALAFSFALQGVVADPQRSRVHVPPGIPRIAPASIYMRLQGQLKAPGGIVPTVYRPVNTTLAGTSSLATTFTEYQTITLSLAGTSSFSGPLALNTTQDAERPRPHLPGVPLLRPASLRMRLAMRQTQVDSVASVTKNITLSLAGTSSLSSTVTEYHRFTVTLAGTSSLTATTRELHRFSLTLAGTSSLATTIREFHRFSLTLAGTSSLTATIVELHRITLTLAGTSTFSSPLSYRITNAPFSPEPRKGGIPNLRPVPLALKLNPWTPPSRPAAVYRPVNVAIAGTSSLSSTIKEFHRITVTLAGTSSFSATIRELHRFSLTLAGTSSLSASVKEYQQMTVSFDGTSKLQLVEYFLDRFNNLLQWDTGQEIISGNGTTITADGMLELDIFQSSGSVAFGRAQIPTLRNDIDLRGAVTEYRLPNIQSKTTGTWTDGYMETGRESDDACGFLWHPDQGFGIHSNNFEIIGANNNFVFSLSVLPNRVRIDNTTPGTWNYYVSYDDGTSWTLLQTETTDIDLEPDRYYVRATINNPITPADGHFLFQLDDMIVQTPVGQPLVELHRFTLSLAGTSSLSTSIRELHRLTVSLAGTSSLSTTFRELHRITLALTGTSSLTASVRVPPRIFITFAGTSSLSGTTKALRRFTASLAGRSSLASVFTEYHRFSLNLSGAGHVTASITEYLRLHVNLTATSSLSTSLNLKRSIRPSFAGVGHIAATIAEYRRITANLSGTSSVASTIRETAAITTHLAGTSTLTANFIEILTIPATFFVTDTVPRPPWKTTGAGVSTNSGKPAGSTKSDTPRGRWIIRR